MIRDCNIANNANIQPHKILGGGIGLGVGSGPSGKESKAIYVNANGGSNGFDGLTPDKPLLTITEACVRVKARQVFNPGWPGGGYPWTGWWGHNDHIVIAPGLYTDALTDCPWGVTFVGEGQPFGQTGYAQHGVEWKPSSTNEIIDQIRLQSVSFHNIKFQAGAAAGKLFNIMAAESLWFEDCFFQGGAATSSSTYGIYIGDHWMLGGMKNCFMTYCASGLWINYAQSPIDYAFHTLYGCYFENLTITSAETNGIYMHAQSQSTGSAFKGCAIGGGGGITCDYPVRMHCGTNYFPAFYDCHFLGSTLLPAVPATSSQEIYAGCTFNGDLVT